MRDNKLPQDREACRRIYRAKVRNYGSTKGKKQTEGVMNAEFRPMMTSEGKE